jgi:OmpA family protein
MHRTAAFLAIAGGLLASSAAAAQTASTTSLAQAGAGEHVVYFDLGQATLDADDLTVIAAAASEFRSIGATRLVVRGHTDTSGNADRNRELSERRARAVADELVRQGVPTDAITTDAVGETELAVQTGDNVVEANNRRVEIAIEQPAPPPPAPAPAPAPEPAPPVAAAEPAPEPEEDRAFFSLGAFYGYNLQDDADEDREGTSHLAGLNLNFTYAVTDWMGLNLEQAGFYNFGTEDDGFGGRSAAGLNFGILDWDVIPYVGGNIGYIYGSGIEGDFFAGPEIGIALGWFNAKVAYDMPFGRSWDEGIVATTIGLGIRF